MKKIITSAILFSFLQVVIPYKNASAGLFFTAGMGVSDGTTGRELLVSFGTTMLVMTGGIILAVKKIGPRWATIPLTVGLTFLEEKPTFSDYEIEPMLMNRYPFVENNEVIKLLSKEIREGYQNATVKNGAIYVSIPKDKIESILENIDLSQEDKLLILNELN